MQLVETMFSANPPSMHEIIGVQEGIFRHFTGGAEKFALKITICPETNFFSLIRRGPETSCKSVLYS